MFLTFLLSIHKCASHSLLSFVCAKPCYTYIVSRIFVLEILSQNSALYSHLFRRSCRFDFPNGSFCILKEVVSKDKTASFRMLSAKTCVSMTYDKCSFGMKSLLVLGAKQMR